MDKIPTGWDSQQIKRQASFLQSGLWGAFQGQVGARPHYLNGDGWSCLLLEKKNRIGRYLFSQYGPTVDSLQSLQEALASIKDLGRQLGAAWVSLEPMGRNIAVEDIRTVIKQSGGKISARHREPELTRIIDLSPPADQLLANISQSTRSFIRKNQRENFLTFKTSSDPKDIPIFTKMLDTVSDRKKVQFFSEDYFQKQAQILMPANMMFLESALINNKPVASALFHDYGAMCTYTYAGSLPEGQKTSASALLLWHSILNAKARGRTKMDLYGIAPDNAASSHPWYGFTSFKAKFDGQVVKHAGTWDISLSPKYSVYKTAHLAKRLVRRH